MAANTILAAIQDFNVYLGDSLEVVARLFEEDGSDYDLQQWEDLAMQIKPIQTSCNAAVDASLGNGLAVIPYNTLYIIIPGEQMAGLSEGTWFYDVEGRTGDEVGTVMAGKIFVTQDTTRNKN